VAGYKPGNGGIPIAIPLLAHHLFPSSQSHKAPETINLPLCKRHIWPLIVIREDSRQLIQIGLRSMTAIQDTTNWGVVMAGAILAMLPPLIVFILLHQQFMTGFALGQEK
jgi:hypothetical protein